MMGIRATTAMPAREYPARVSDVIDGDTVRMLVDLGGKTYAEWDIRLKDAWCPERSQPGGFEATSFTREWITAHVDHAGWLRIRTYKATAGTWKPGDAERRTFVRYVADVLDFWTGASLADALVMAGHATVTEP
jgi:endonuclease YncB( thermonuclease family)